MSRDLAADYAERVREKQRLIREFEGDNCERLLIGLPPLKWGQWLSQQDTRSTRKPSKSDQENANSKPR
jgi:hypothetical protein